MCGNAPNYVHNWKLCASAILHWIESLVTQERLPWSEMELSSVTGPICERVLVVRLRNKLSLNCWKATGKGGNPVAPNLEKTVYNGRISLVQCIWNIKCWVCAFFSCYTFHFLSPTTKQKLNQSWTQAWSQKIRFRTILIMFTNTYVYQI